MGILCFFPHPHIHFAVQSLKHSTPDAKLRPTYFPISSVIFYFRLWRLTMAFLCCFTVPPMIWIQNQLVGAALTQNITLECQSEAYPKSINYWMKNDTIIVPGKSIRDSNKSETIVFIFFGVRNVVRGNTIII